jgi:hypothetical protein
MSLTGGFGERVEERKEEIRELQGRAHELHVRWVKTFGPHDTPVPIDRAWNNLHIALEDVQGDPPEDRIAAAREQLDQTDWILSEAA